MSAVLSSMPETSPPPPATEPNGHVTPLLQLRGISKSFPGVKALQDVELTLRAGRVTALIGENGAGKSTLVKILTGIYQPDAGEILVGGVPTRFDSPDAAQAARITAIHQETVLFDELTVAENIYLGHAPRTRLGFVNWAAMRARSAALLRASLTTASPRLRVAGDMASEGSGRSSAGVNIRDVPDPGAVPPMRLI